MSNSWFQFKQFRIEQDRCGMKVSTDACIQGAWAPVPAEARTLLDIGTGTGLLALMLAQRLPEVAVAAVELDENAAAQAAANAAASPWADRIAVFNRDAKNLPPGNFDFIVCNPPFFHRSLQGPDSARNLARHGDSLRQEELLAILEAQLGGTGAACLLLPVPEHEQWAALAGKEGWSCQSRLLVQDNPAKTAGRIISVWARGAVTDAPSQSLLIRDGENVYTEAFRSLLEPFYLHF